ncbi:MAG: hypothetical protein ACHQPI_08500 [Thermoanaerobaculia bacterium]
MKLAASGALTAALLLAAPASAFDSKGHNVVEALAYRTLAEGRDGMPPRPEVLRDLLNDGALEPPFCFGRNYAPPRECRDVASENPLLEWPQPRTDRPDAFFRRQFTDPGQCFHYMATLTDAQTGSLGGTSIPRALATTAVVRCNDFLDDVLRQVVVDGGPGTRRGGTGLYELMHSVADSFSEAHTQRTPGGDVDYLRVWKPIEKMARIPTARSARIPAEAYHVWNDHRDKTYVKEGGAESCEKRTNQPYDVPYECLSEDGDHARRALAELLIVVHDLRAAQLAAPAGTQIVPERSDAWAAYKSKWFRAAHACEGRECEERQPADTAPGSYAAVGLDTAWNPTRRFSEVTARGTVLKFSEELNPFVYALSARVGYRRYREGESAGLAGLDFDFALPVGLRGFLGFTPAGFLATFGSGRTGPEWVTRFLRFDYMLSRKLSVSFIGPLEVNWMKPQAEWSLGVGVSYALGASRLAGGPILVQHKEAAERKDEAWLPPPAPYGRLKGRAPSWYVISGGTLDRTPSVAVEGQNYGVGTLGAEVVWDRDRWGGRFAIAPTTSLAIGARATTGDSAYLTGILATGFRWYVLRGLALSVTGVRIEGGPKIRGKSEFDPSPGVHGDPGSEYYFRAGSRIGMALNAGIFDLLVEGPTCAWSSDPFGAGEIFSVRLGIRLN